MFFYAILKSISIGCVFDESMAFPVVKVMFQGRLHNFWTVKLPMSKNTGLFFEGAYNNSFEEVLLGKRYVFISELSNAGTDVIILLSQAFGRFGLILLDAIILFATCHEAGVYIER